MKKIFKISISVMLIIFVTVNLSNISAYAATISRYGFSYDSSKYTVEWKVKQSIIVKSKTGAKLGTMTYVIGLAREKSGYNFLLLVKEVMTPNSQKVLIDNSNNNKKYGYGYSEYVSIKAYLPGDLENYTPQNTPKTNSTTLSMGVSASGPSISASYTINNSDLDVTAKCDTTKDMFYIVYDYIPSIINPFASNKYVANESSQYGIAHFSTEKNTSSFGFYINYEAKFGVSSNESRSPLSIYNPDVWTKGNTATYFYEFKLN